MANPLALVESARLQKMSPQEWADRGNAYLRGEIAGVKGEFINHHRRDVRWIVRDGKCVIEWA